MTVSIGNGVDIGNLVTSEIDPVTGGIVFPGAPIQMTRMRQRVVLIGDSHIAFAGGTSIATPVQALSATNYDSKGVFNHVNFRLNHSLEVVGNAGIGGQKSGEILARFSTDVLAYASEWVYGVAGTNDTSSADNTAVNIVAMWDAAIADGRKVMWQAIPPQTSATDAVNQYHMQCNTKLKVAASRRAGVIFVDASQAILDVATTFKALAGTMQADGTHEAPFGAALTGELIADAWRPYLHTENPWLAQSNGDLDNLLSNGLFSGSGSAIATGWSKVGSGSTISYVADPNGTIYPWMQFSIANGTAGGQGMTANANIGANLAVGDVCIAVIELDGDTFDLAAAANTQGFKLTLQAYNGSSFFSTATDLYWDTSYSNFRMQGPGVLQTPQFVIPAGTTLIQFYFLMYGGGNIRVRRAAIRNLTKLGLA